MNILILSTSDTGGAANACMRLHEGLLQTDVSSKVLVIQQKKRIPEVYNYLDIYKPRTLLKRLLKAPRVLYFRRKQNQLKKGRSTTEMYSTIDSLHDITRHPLYKWADIVNIHWVVNFLDYTSFFKKNTKPVVWTLHDMFLFTGGYHYEKGFPFDQYTDLISEQISQKKQLFKDKPLTIVSPSIWLFNLAKEHQHMYPLATHWHIPYGIDTHIFTRSDQIEARKQLRLPLDKNIILFVAASVKGKRKGIQHLLDAIRNIKSENIAIAIMGKLDEPLYIDNVDIHSLGYLTDTQKIALSYSAADLFVIPSIEDNLPNTVIESLSCGTPVVGFNIGGIPDMVLPGKNGEICSHIDTEELAKSITKALDTEYDPSWIRQNTIERYDLPVQAQQYIKLFQSNLKEGK